MTIKEWIIENEIIMAGDRLERLLNIEAPAIIIEGQKKFLEQLGRGEIDIRGDVGKLENEFTGFEQKKGRGGKIYIEFSDGTKYFPQARYGRFIVGKEQ